MNYMPFQKYEKLVRHKNYKFDIGTPDVNQLGIVTSKKLGNAVKRNKLRRQIKEMYRYYECNFKPGNMLVVVAKDKMIGESYNTMRDVFGDMLKKLRLIDEKINNKAY